MPIISEMKIQSTNPTTSDNDAAGFIKHMSEIYNSTTRRRWFYNGEGDSGVGDWIIEEGAYYRMSSGVSGDTVTGTTSKTSFASEATIYGNVSANATGRQVDYQRFRIKCGGTFDVTGGTGSMEFGVDIGSTTRSVTIDTAGVGSSGAWVIDAEIFVNSSTTAKFLGRAIYNKKSDLFSGSEFTWDQQSDVSLSVFVTPPNTGNTHVLEFYSVEMFWPAIYQQ